MQIVQKRTGDCFGCKRIGLKKSQNFKRISRHGCVIYICQMCGYNNSPAIFEERIKVPKQKLVFGYPIKK